MTEHGDTAAGTGPALGTAVLTTADISVSYGGLKALSNVSTEVFPGHITGLIGPNGAGKSTLLGVISGLVQPETGQVKMRGHDISRLGPEARARLGLARTFQLPELFGELTVRDHLVLARRAHHQPRRLVSDIYTGRGFAKPSSEEDGDVEDILALLGIAAIAQRKVLGLSLGATRLVEVGRALASSPSVLLADEPCSGLDRNETARLGEALAKVVAERNLGVLLVEHDVDLVLGLSAHVSVLDFGQLIAEGNPADVRSNPAVKAAYLGSEVAPPEAATDSLALRARPLAPATRVETPGGTDGELLLDVKSLSVYYGPAQAIDTVTLQVRRGAAVAVLGANGAGKSTLSRAVSGLIPPRSGSVSFAGTDVTHLRPHEVRRLGLAYLPEGRGIFPGLSVRENLRMAVQSTPRDQREEATQRAIGFFPVLGSRGRQLAGSLSGGEQQMLSLARALAVTPQLIIGDELSLGLAPLVIDAVFAGLEQAKAQGISIIVIEQFIHRALAMCDYAYILRRGSVCWEGPGQEAADGAAEYYLGSTA